MKRILVLTEVELPSDFPGQVEHYLDNLVTVEVRKTNFEGLKSQFRDVRRGQIKADELLDYLEPRVRNYEGFDKIVLVIDDDGYVQGLNFVFGVAKIGGSLALVFTKRLRGEQTLYHTRILKEVLHELGHSFGLDHCPNPRCVMYFSNTITDTDRKGPGFCERCIAKLHTLIR
ncbi:archaemetzincin family Zn-dependent metalloprotease [Vulcanisaeta sp. JCM 14467]|uniref:archaemetzincin family Zn-dependent metalloprotease n=1 Tax=Vulcanisaeta sp. JCM 14467 TaxID=1295370 RepID=UPI0006D03D31|nr:archaemetzincin family Zn-dependent metalloprotease [Vulcanisaeta sp. JCM 14467]